MDVMGNEIWSSPNLASFRDKKCVLGFDETRRGPIIGTMAVCSIDHLDQLSEMLKVADSKKSSDEQCETIFEKLGDVERRDYFAYAVRIFAPQYSESMQRIKFNSNEVSHETAMKLVEFILRCGIQIEGVFIETDAHSAQEKLMKKFPKLKIVVSKKSDSQFPIVDAASICAEAIKDRAVVGWQFENLDLKKMVEAGSEGSEDRSKDKIADVAKPTSLLERLEAACDSSIDDPLRRQWFDEARQRFREVASEPLWCRLSADIVCELLDGDENLRQIGEREIFQSVMKWLAHNADQVAGQVDRLLRTVRFSVMSTEDKFKCLDEAKRIGVHTFVKPYVMEADWYRTCVELSFPEFTDLVEFDRSTVFVGEGRRDRAIETYSNVKRRSRSLPAGAVGFSFLGQDKRRFRLLGGQPPTPFGGPIPIDRRIPSDIQAIFWRNVQTFVDAEAAIRIFREGAAKRKPAIKSTDTFFLIYLNVEQNAYALVTLPGVGQNVSEIVFNKTYVGATVGKEMHSQTDLAAVITSAWTNKLPVNGVSLTRPAFDRSHQAVEQQLGVPQPAPGKK